MLTFNPQFVILQPLAPYDFYPAQKTLLTIFTC